LRIDDRGGRQRDQSQQGGDCDETGANWPAVSRESTAHQYGAVLVQNFSD